MTDEKFREWASDFFWKVDSLLSDFMASTPVLEESEMDFCRSSLEAVKKAFDEAMEALDALKEDHQKWLKWEEENKEWEAENETYEYER